MPIGDETPKEWAAAGLREEAVRRLVGLPAEERTRERVAREARQIGISTTTMFRLLAAWRHAPVRPTLLPEPRGAKRGSLRTPVAKRQIINEAVERFFLRREAPRISDLCDEIEARCRFAGLTPPSRATVERHVAALDQRRIIRLREGPTAASSALRSMPLRQPSELNPQAIRHLVDITQGVTARIFRVLADLAEEAILSEAERINSGAVLDLPLAPRAAAA